MKMLKRLIPGPIKRGLKRLVNPGTPDFRKSLAYEHVGPQGPLLRDVFAKINHVPGAFNVDDAGHFHLVLSMQSVFGITGDLLEIGSYHGRSTAVMSHYLRGREKIHVCDAFTADTDDKYQNKPTPEALLANVQRVTPGIGDRIVIHACLSNDLRLPAEQMFRFIRVDGGHSEEQAFADLTLVKRHLRDRGVIVVDDYDHKEWPGVTPAVDRFLKANPDISVLADLNRHGAKGRKIYLMKGAGS